MTSLNFWNLYNFQALADKVARFGIFGFMEDVILNFVKLMKCKNLAAKKDKYLLM